LVAREGGERNRMGLEEEVRANVGGGQGFAWGGGTRGSERGSVGRKGGREGGADRRKTVGMGCEIELGGLQVWGLLCIVGREGKEGHGGKGAGGMGATGGRGGVG